ncbi:ISAs1 family transposase [Kribbella antibiotica]|uniref:ISAs1 family transposase n=1 Tax=Kribbella antibiotica TaxID=190195 RepID=UPI001EDD33E3|nr:ISAs1 family transposase [Kribbella antibiotica]
MQPQASKEGFASTGTTRRATRHHRVSGRKARERRQENLTRRCHLRPPRRRPPRPVPRHVDVDPHPHRRLASRDRSGRQDRGARSKTTTAPHLVAALDQATGTVIGQFAVTAKSNEIPAVQGLLKLFDLTNVVVTVDAMLTQTDTAQQITTAGGAYVFTVKANQPKLLAACKNLPWKDVPSHTSTSRGHGRKATRTIKVTTAPAWVEFAGATQFAQVRRTVTRNGKKTVEIVYLITSADHQAPPATLAAWVQAHWGIENRLHRIRDVTYDEDRSEARTGNSPQVMATLRNTAISLLRLTGAENIAQRLRHHARNPETILNLLLSR